VASAAGDECLADVHRLMELTGQTNPEYESGVEPLAERGEGSSVRA
jgi:hypothetical protein